MSLPPLWNFNPDSFPHHVQVVSYYIAQTKSTLPPLPRVQVVSYYIAQTKSSHHGVREAACACIAELMEKV